MTVCTRLAHGIVDGIIIRFEWELYWLLLPVVRSTFFPQVGHHSWVMSLKTLLLSRLSSFIDVASPNGLSG